MDKKMIRRVCTRHPTLFNAAGGATATFPGRGFDLYCMQFHRRQLGSSYTAPNLREWSLQPPEFMYMLDRVIRVAVCGVAIVSLFAGAAGVRAAGGAKAYWPQWRGAGR